MHDQIFDLVYYGKGFTYQDVTDMPIYLRVYYINKINKIFKDKNKAQEKANKEAQSKSRARPPRFKR